MGQVLKVNFEYDSPSSLSALGDDNGYQHLYLEGKGKPSSANTKFSWLGNGKYYTLTSATKNSDELLFTRVGANDPEFNLRRDAALMIRRNNSGDTVFASVIEPHGSYSRVSELSVNAKSNVSKLKVLYDDQDYTAVSIEDRLGNSRVFILSNMDASAHEQHQLEIDNKVYAWTGPYHFRGQ